MPRRDRNPPVVQTPYGPMTESARAQAAQNMLLDSVKRYQVEDLLTRQCGSRERAIAKMRHDYPELFELGATGGIV